MATTPQLGQPPGSAEVWLNSDDSPPQRPPSQLHVEGFQRLSPCHQMQAGGRGVAVRHVFVTGRILAVMPDVPVWSRSSRRCTRRPAPARWATECRVAECPLSIDLVYLVRQGLTNKDRSVPSPSPPRASDGSMSTRAQIVLWAKRRLPREVTRMARTTNPTVRRDHHHGPHTSSELQDAVLRVMNR